MEAFELLDEQPDDPLVVFAESRNRELGDIANGLKTAAKEFDVCIVLLSQLNRKADERSGAPQMSDLRESGAIENDADVILFIYRDEVYNEETAAKGVAEIIVGKQRNGPVGTVKLSFHAANTRFTDLEGEY